MSAMLEPFISFLSNYGNFSLRKIFPDRRNWKSCCPHGECCRLCFLHPFLRFTHSALKIALLWLLIKLRLPQLHEYLA